MLAIWLCAGDAVRAQSPAAGGHSWSASDPALPTKTSAFKPSSARINPLTIRAGFTSKFTDDGETVWLLRGDCEIQQGEQRWSAPLMVLWQLSGPNAPQQRILAYMEGTSEQNVRVTGPDGQESRPYLLVHLSTTGADVLMSRVPEDLPKMASDPAYLRASLRRQEAASRLQQTQFTFDAPGGGAAFSGAAPRIRQRVTIGPRFLGDRLEAKGDLLEGSLPPEYVVTLTGGVNIVVDNVPVNLNGQTVLSRIDLTADRAVIWTDANHIGELGGFEIDSSTPFQVYLEGNIVVRQGTNTVRASHAYYDINQHRGLAMNAEVRTLLPDLQGTLRLRAAEVRQNSERSFHARDGFFTTSEFGKPKYRIQSSDLFLEERSAPGPAAINPFTGQPGDGLLWVTSVNNTVFVDDVPIFAAPYLSGPAENPNIPIQKFNVGYSGMFGATIETAWDMEAIFGLDLPPRVNWQLQADYLTSRGPGVGTRGLFDFDGNLLGQPVHNVGWGQLYYINDHGLDNLGYQRRDLPFPSDNRGRVILRDRVYLNENTWVQGEIGEVFNNDRNYLEQYYEYEWDTQKDLENLLVLNHQVDNLTGTIQGAIRSDNFNDQTNWLPKADLTLLGEPLFGSPVTWSTHSSVGYGQLKPAQPPPNPAIDPFAPLYYFQNVEGFVGMTRHELSLPFDVGPVHVNPYVLGELAYWEQDLNGDSLGRAYGSAGLRASVEFAKYMPQVRSSILGLNGLAHKVVYDLDYYYAQSTASLSNIAQYNEFDDNAQERFRERMIPVEFGGTLPPVLDPRFYAVRSGVGRDVTAPYYELVDDQHTLWLGMRHRWQTKVGPLEAPRIIDWMELDLGTAIFPNANRDNFGQTFGLLNGRYAWHVSPRTSILANGVFDFFAGGQRVWNVGVLNQRSARGSMYLGYRQVQASTINSDLLTGSFSYVMSPNLYVVTAGAQFDVAEGLDRGESLTITRIGEFFLLHCALGYDRSRNIVGAALMLEPKFGSYGSSSMQLNSLLGIR